tara:strand:- start:6479 stop:6787 length:309 start_codon:yes stop_codon:yes gene_type:complete
MDTQKIIAETKPGKAPIWFCNLNYNILTLRGKKVLRQPYRAVGIVLKGSLDINNITDDTKKRLLFRYFGNDKKNYDKIKEFKLDRVEIVKITVVKFFSYGVK